MSKEALSPWGAAGRDEAEPVEDWLDEVSGGHRGVEVAMMNSLISSCRSTSGRAPRPAPTPSGYRAHAARWQLAWASGQTRGLPRAGGAGRRGCGKNWPGAAASDPWSDGHQSTPAGQARHEQGGLPGLGSGRIDRQRQRAPACRCTRRSKAPVPTFGDVRLFLVLTWSARIALVTPHAGALHGERVHGRGHPDAQGRAEVYRPAEVSGSP